MAKKVSVKIPARTPGKPHRFEPNEVSIHAGDTVEWVNEDESLHTVTPDVELAFPGADLDGVGATHTHTFDKPGEYSYHCEIHLSMTGVIKVSYSD